MKCFAFYLISIEATLFRAHLIREERINLLNVTVLRKSKMEIEAMYC